MQAGQHRAFAQGFKPVCAGASDSLQGVQQERVPVVISRTGDLGPARVGPQERGQDVDDGRLARAVGAEQPEHRALFDAQRHPLEGAYLPAESLDEVFGENRSVTHASNLGESADIGRPELGCHSCQARP